MYILYNSYSSGLKLKNEVHSNCFDPEMLRFDWYSYHFWIIICHTQSAMDSSL